MKWYNFIACFFLGVFLVNSTVHFIQGISGNSFPTPFASPPGKGLSHPTVNVVWALFNMAVCILLYRASKITQNNAWTIFLFAAGFVAMSIRLSTVLANKG
jgi:hypothetical protein